MYGKPSKAGHSSPAWGLTCGVFKMLLVVLPLVGGCRVSFVKQKPQNHMVEVKFGYRAIEVKIPGFGDNK